MDSIQLLNNECIQEIAKQYSLVKEKKRQVAYNLFTISSYNSYLENFHSDIIASLLNPNGLHQHSYDFLHLFITFLNEHYDFNILASDFKQTIVTRETGRLDIWIRDEKSRQSIIIENKINNAPDMDDQLDRYFIYAGNIKKYEVKAVIYLSLDGTKKAPPVKENFDIINIGAYTDSVTDLINGWLKPCFKFANNMDSKSIIHQYINLIQHLANKNMDSKTMEHFYQFVSNNGIESVKAISEMYSRIAEHRADRFSNSVKDITPFSKSYRWKPNYWLYENFKENNYFYKLDVWFENDGSASLVFWIPAVNERGRMILTEKLKSLNIIHEFEDEISYGYNGYPKYFRISETYRTMNEVDNAIISFVNKFLEALRSSQQ